MTEGPEWSSLWRKLPTPVKQMWEQAERRAAARLDIEVGTKHQTPNGWQMLYTAIAQHLLQMSDEDWENF